MHPTLNAVTNILTGIRKLILVANYWHLKAGNLRYFISCIKVHWKRVRVIWPPLCTEKITSSGISMRIRCPCLTIWGHKSHSLLLDLFLLKHSKMKTPSHHQKSFDFDNASAVTNTTYFQMPSYLHTCHFVDCIQVDKYTCRTHLSSDRCLVHIFRVLVHIHWYLQRKEKKKEEISTGMLSIKQLKLKETGIKSKKHT